VWPREKPLAQAQLAEHLHGRRMNGIAAEISEKVGVFLEQSDLYAGACQQQREHCARWSAADDARRGGLGVVHLDPFLRQLLKKQTRPTPVISSTLLKKRSLLATVNRDE
jgi:hypothetical protein